VLKKTFFHSGRVGILLRMMMKNDEVQVGVESADKGQVRSAFQIHFKILNDFER
jgi:hypothetical protein